MQKPDQDSARAYLFRFLAAFLLLLGAGALVIAPYLALWIRESGDSGVERAVRVQAGGEFALFGSGISQDFVDYKLRLYAAALPDIVAIGSSRVMQFRGGWFRGKFLNMGGVAGNLAVLRSTIDAMLRIKKPQAVLIGIDFWWFMPQWEENPDEYVAPTSGSYNYSLASLKKPLEWLMEGKISFTQLGAPILGIFGKGFRTDRFGIMAQQTNDGFGPDGSWYYTAEVSGLKPPLDYKFQDTLTAARRGIRAFFHARPDQPGPEEAHVDVFAEIICRLKSRNIATWVFMPPLARAVLREMDPALYPHLFKLREALAKRGIDVADFTAPEAIGATDCEFVDGFHGGEIAYARILRGMADKWPALLPYVNMARLDRVINDWAGHATSRDARVSEAPEADFLGLGCIKKK